MRKIIVISCFIASLVSQGQVDQTQEDEKIPTFWDHIQYGGGLGLTFGTNQTSIEISPSAIYDFDNNFALGISLGYLYSRVGDFKSNVIIPGLVALYNPAEEIQLSAEFEHLFVNQNLGSLGGNFDFSALYFGLAYRTGWAAFGIRYDVLYDERDTIFTSPWSPIIRFYF